MPKTKYELIWFKLNKFYFINKHLPDGVHYIANGIFRNYFLQTILFSRHIRIYSQFSMNLNVIKSFYGRRN